MRSEDFKRRKNETLNHLNNTIDGLDRGYAEAGRVSNVVENTRQILDDLDERFRKQTGLTGTDVVFLFLATGCKLRVNTYFPTKRVVLVHHREIS